MISPCTPEQDGAVKADRLLELGRPAQARDLLQSLLTTLPDDPGLLARMAQAQLDLHEPELALAAARAGSAGAPDSAAPFLLAALALEELGRGEEGLAWAQRAVVVRPELWSTHLRVALLASTLPERHALAQEAAARCVELAPNEADSHFSVGIVAQRSGDLRTAERAYRQALLVDPQHRNAHNNLGVLFLERGESIRAADAYLTAAALDPNHGPARDNLDGVVRRWLWPSLIFPVLVGYASVILFDSPAAAARTAGFVLGLWLLVAVVLLVRMPVRLRRVVRSYPRRHRRPVAVTCAAIAVVLTVVLTGSLGSPAAQPLLLAFAVGGTLVWLAEFVRLVRLAFAAGRGEPPARSPSA